MSIQYLDNEKIYYSFLSGAQEVIRNKRLLNEINVFPVADGDTGSNLASTMNAIVREAKILKTVRDTLNSIADAALTGARGNSGIIIAQYFNGIFMSLRDDGNITLQSFANMVKNAVPHAYEAISNPVEGTIITVIREWADAVDRYKDTCEDFHELFRRSLVDAQISLKATTGKLKVLEESHVVDSGAKGFVYFLQGFADFLRTGHFAAENGQEEEILAFAELPGHDHDVVTHRYCTEALLSGVNLNLEGLRSMLSPLGDSLIIAGHPAKVKIHLHTSTPEKLFQLLRSQGEIIEQKADDMLRQYEDAYQKKSSIALVTDSIADVPQEILDRHQIHMFPLNLVFENTSYLDKVTMTPEIFYPLLEQAPEYPKSAQPNPKQLEAYFSALTRHYDEILVITVASAQSGTHSAFVKAAEKFAEQGKRIIVVDSKQNSGAEGLLVWKAAERIAEGWSLDKIVTEVEDLRSRTKILVSVNTLKFMVRSGRLNKATGLLGKWMNLKPVISIDEAGKGKIEEKAFSEGAAREKILKIVQTAQEKEGITRYAIVHANDPKRAEEYRKACVQILKKEPDYIMNISTIVGMSAGVGCVAVSYMCEKEA